MKFTLSWLKKFLDTESSVEEISKALTDIGLEVEGITDRSQELKDFKVAKIIKAEPHQGADKLRVCSVETSDGTLQIVCGAPNAREGIYVVLAPIGSIVPHGNFKIKESEIRGVKSFGMLCSETELMVGDDTGGIIELPEHAKIGDQFAHYYGIGDPVFDISITPNRGDALGVYGIARDLAAKGIGILKPLEIPKINEQFQSAFSLQVEDPIACPLFSFREIKNIKNTQSPDWLKKLLQNIGVGSISPVVDVTNYIAYSFGHPMHSYDADKISGGLKVEILNDKTKFQALNSKEYDLDVGDLIIRDDDEIQCLAGIIGGLKSSCSEDTTSIILEAACFSPSVITKAARRLQIDTDSKYRYERNVDQAFTLKALDYATDMILSICGGTASAALCKGETKVASKSISVSPAFLTTMTGIVLGYEEIVLILEKLGFGVTIVNDEFEVTVPSWRHDIGIKEDIVEEIVRIYGYDKIPAVCLPDTKINRIIDNKQRRVNDLRRIIASIGYTELVTYSFIDKNTAKLFADINEDLVVINPISVDLNYMRPSIVPNILKAIAKNQARSFKDMAFFEIGPVFDENNENNVLTVARCGDNISKNWRIKHQAIDIFDIKSDLSIALSFIGCPIERCQTAECKLPYYHPTRSATLQLGKTIIGHFGQIHPIVLKHFDIDGEVFAFELNIDNIPLTKQKFGKKDEFKVSDFPTVIRDYAFVIDVDMSVGDILSYAKNIDKKLIKSVELFDIYAGDNMEAGKKSIAISITIQADDRTLTEVDLTNLSNLIITSIQQKFTAVLRS